jgi:hypothetical protein
MTLVPDPYSLAPFAYLAGGGGLFYGVVKLSEQIEKGLSEDTKIRIALWVLSTDITNRAEAISRTFTSVFDRVFGTRHFSLSCFLKSCLMSLASILVMMLFWVICLNHVFDVSVIGFHLLVAVILGVVFNILPDYISLLFTRRCISFAGRHRSIPTRTILTVGNLVICVSIYAIFMSIALTGFMQLTLGGHCMSAFYLPCRYLQWGNAEATILSRLDFIFLKWFGQMPLTELQVSLYEKHQVAFAEFVDYPKIFFISTLLTTFWFWLYVFGGFVTGLASGFGFLRDHLDVEQKPLYGIGLVVGGVFAVIWWAGAIASAFL